MNVSGIAIIGGGNLGGAIAEGLLSSHYIKPASLTVTRRKTERINYLKEMGVDVTADNNAAVRGKSVVIVAVKPYKIAEVLKSLADDLAVDRPIVVSVVTGVDLADMQKWLPNDVPLFRAMPNTAIAIGQSMTCMSTNNGTEAQIETVSGLFNQLGKTVLIDDELMEAATVQAACGIAYAMRFIRAATQGGIEIGFDAQTAALIASQTVKGAAELLITRGHHPEAEIDKVTTPQGCTIVGLNEMEFRGFSSALIRGIKASYDKIGKIGNNDSQELVD